MNRLVDREFIEIVFFTMEGDWLVKGWNLLDILQTCRMGDFFDKLTE